MQKLPPTVMGTRRWKSFLGNRRFFRLGVHHKIFIITFDFLKKLCYNKYIKIKVYFRYLVAEKSDVNEQNEKIVLIFGNL